jgi:integrase
MGVKVREKRAGEYWLFVNHHGRRTSKRIGSDKDTALEVAEKLRAKLVLGEFGIMEKKDIPTFKEYAERWLEIYVKQVRRPATYDRYSFTLRQYIFPKIGSKPLNLITRGDFRNVLLTARRKSGEPLSRSTISLMKDVCSGVLTHAMDDELISVNPTHGLIKRLQLERDKRSDLDPLTHEEVGLFMEKCRELYPEYCAFFLCAFRTGMRMGELLALQWSDVDWNGKFIRVERSYKLGRISATKTGKARRVDMSDQLCETLKGLYPQAKKDGFRMGLGEAVEVIFHRDGAPMEQNYIRRVFKRILEKAKLREIRFHDIRHTYASLLLSDGVTPVYVKEQMGHSSIQMTVDIYGHLIPSSNRGAVNRLDTRFNAHPNAPQAHPPKTKEPQPLEIAALS